ncbi:ferredoxin [Microbacterium sp. SYP-A9085]|nr:ferredoxin [Microbacterium sp. SYP-A9085]
MRIEANRNLCQSYGNCVVIAPDHLDLDEEGLVTVTSSDVSSADLETVQAAVRSCPVHALRLVDDSDDGNGSHG